MSRSRSLNTAVSRVTNRGAKSRSSRRRPPHDIRICQPGGNFLSQDRVILKSSLTRTERGAENRERVEEARDWAGLNNAG